jgi:hypothetical protein
MFVMDMFEGRFSLCAAKSTLWLRSMPEGEILSSIKSGTPVTLLKVLKTL